jgi:hypothetical protein
MLNDLHSGACGIHLSGLDINQNILHARYFWVTIFKYCVEAVKRCHSCHILSQKMHTHPTLLFSVITIDPFRNWGVDFTTCHLPSSTGNHCIIVFIKYFTKWVEAMPTFVNDGDTATLFMFNQVITRFRVPREIFTDHGSQF